VKTCSYCGAGTEDTASACSQCGITFSGHASQRAFILRHLYLDPDSRFRVILVVGLVSYLLNIAGAWVLWRNLPGDTADAVAWAGFGAVLALPPVVQWATVALWIAATIGIYFFIPAARLLYTFLVGFAMFTTLVGGVHVNLPVEAFLIYVASISDGAVLVLAYWSPLRKLFHGASIE
jgi:hypothetical protein